MSSINTSNDEVAIDVEDDIKDINEKVYEKNHKNIVEKIKINIRQLKIVSKDKQTLNSRYLDLVKKYHINQNYYYISFNFGRLIVMFGTILVPALLNSETIIDKNVVYWAVWTISLTVSLINAYINVFKIDKKYYSNMWMLENLVCEFWQYNSLCGKYSGGYTHSKPNHQNQFVYFCNNVERLQMKNVEENYPKTFDNANGEEKEKKVVKSVDSTYYSESAKALETEAIVEEKKSQ
jgi:Protein of unknown function (DUF4231)